MNISATKSAVLGSNTTVGRRGASVIKAATGIAIVAATHAVNLTVEVAKGVHSERRASGAMTRASCAIQPGFSRADGARHIVTGGVVKCAAGPHFKFVGSDINDRDPIGLAPASRVAALRCMRVTRRQCPL
eukprot:NODE_6521_length_1665_cov_2.899220.p4 GENE.NODE_6521_length_1665_cov_2.899220~~NODE_6521_length_1665_cov_2.899220.p4  ORF type:complete len:131 (-),score=21.37 NODE_6521_length_1665_cov_2.899220:12-404(-)